nr:acetoacetate decarboxylase [Vibrio campbellii]
MSYGVWRLFFMDMIMIEKKQPPFGMPVQQGNSAYTVAPNRFVNREYFIITYETDPDALERVLPPGLEAPEPLVKFEFMRMPDSSGFGSFKESGQVIPVNFEGQRGSYVHSMFLDCHPPIAGGREIWGFPKKLGSPALEIDGDTLLGTLDYGKVRVATGTMGYKFEALDKEVVKEALGEQNFLVKSIPNVDGKPALCQLVRYYMTDINVKWAFTGPASLELHDHAMAPINALPIKRIVSASHFIADLTLPYGEVVIDYLKNER